MIQNKTVSISKKNSTIFQKDASALFEPTTKLKKDTFQKLEEESQAETKAVNTLNEKFFKFGPPRAPEEQTPKSITNPQLILTTAFARAKKEHQKKDFLTPKKNNPDPDGDIKDRLGFATSKKMTSRIRFNGDIETKKVFFHLKRLKT